MSTSYAIPKAVLVNGYSSLKACTTRLSSRNSSLFIAYDTLFLYNSEARRCNIYARDSEVGFISDSFSDIWSMVYSG